jgi:hypothetical protein
VKILMSLIICSSVAQECMPPLAYPTMFDNKYDCLHFGYEESQRRLEDIGKLEVNKHGIYIKFVCTPTNTI